MKIVEIKSNADFAYKSFFLKGLREHEDSFRISPQDEFQAQFPTRGAADSFTLGALSDRERLLGVVSFEREGERREKTCHKGLLFRMYVDKDSGGRGIGKQLIREVVARAKSLGDIEQVNLTVVGANLKAKGLYDLFGFETFSIEINALKYQGKYFNEETMVLFLK